MVRNVEYLDHRCVSARSISPTSSKRKFLGASQVPTSTWSLNCGVTSPCSRRRRSCQMCSWRRIQSSFPYPVWWFPSTLCTCFKGILMPPAAKRDGAIEKDKPLKQLTQKVDSTHSSASQNWLAAPKAKNHMACTIKAQPYRDQTLNEVLGHAVARAPPTKGLNANFVDS